MSSFVPMQFVPQGPLGGVAMGRRGTRLSLGDAGQIRGGADRIADPELRAWFDRQPLAAALLAGD